MAPGQENHQNISFSTSLFIYIYERSGYNCHLSSDCKDLLKLARLALRAKPEKEEQFKWRCKKNNWSIIWRKKITGLGKRWILGAGNQALFVCQAIKIFSENVGKLQIYPRKQRRVTASGRTFCKSDGKKNRKWREKIALSRAHLMPGT